MMLVRASILWNEICNNIEVYSVSIILGYTSTVFLISRAYSCPVLLGMKKHFLSFTPFILAHPWRLIIGNMSSTS